jgi:hypothetical protein
MTCKALLAISLAIFASAGCSESNDGVDDAAGLPSGGFFAAENPAQPAGPGFQGRPAQSPPPGETQNQAQPVQGRLPPGAVRLQKMEIVDSGGFEQPMVAATALVPVGWQARGGVIWGAQPSCGPGYHIDWTATAPDGVAAVAFFPSEQWQTNNMGASFQAGCPQASLSSVEQYLQSYVQRNRPAARILDFRPRPDVAEEFKELNQTTPMPNGEIKMWVESGEMLIGYDAQGREMRELIGATAHFTHNRMASGYPGQVLESFVGNTFTGFAMRAAQGQLDFQLAEAIRKSGQPTPQWQSRIVAHHSKLGAIAQKGAADRSAIIAQHGRDMNDIIMGGWEERNAIQDRSHREVIETIRGVETYDDPVNGGTVQLDHTYENAWQLDDGSYILTNDAYFEPYKELGVDGRRLEATR